ncbi:MAG TPA: MMPL family transporter [Solirubrobacterales bacterium]
MATMIGPGVGIDYALFIVTRHKLQLGEGMEMDESIARATATAGGAVVFAGFTVVIALCSLAVAGIPLVSTLGFTAAVAVVVAVVAAATLLPAMLGALGPHINSFRVHLGKTHPDDAGLHGWRRWAEGVVKMPWKASIFALVILGILALPIFQLDLGQNDISALPKETTSRQAYDGLNAGFGPGVNGPMDYEVFLMTQMKEHYVEYGDERRAVVERLASAGRVITSAAGIMVCVFAGFVLGGDPVVKGFGVGLAVAIALDSTIVRCLLVPAVMELMGKWAWWMPSWLDRIVPRISIEGEEYFEARAATAAAVAAAPASAD